MNVREVVTAPTSEGPPSHLATTAGNLARRLATRTSRRSFIGRVGQAALVGAAASTGLGVLGAREALAHNSGCGSCSGIVGFPQNCCDQLTVGCKNLTGVNACPSNTCNCGCWIVNVSTSTCGSGRREWCDCCGECGSGGQCNCVDVNGTLHPTCCRHKEYSGCATCSGHIHCRKHRCV